MNNDNQLLNQADCIFCKIIRGEIVNDDIIYEDKKVLIMLDEDWAVKGHTLVIWKEHAENASDLSEEDYLYFSKIFHRTEKALLDVLKMNKSIILKSGGLVSHFHFHIYPVSKSISWAETKNIFEKKVGYESSEGERNEFVEKLRDVLMKK